MQLLKSLTIIFTFLVSHLTVLSQNFNYNYSNYKKVVRIGIYVSPKANLHTRVITDIGLFYANTKTAYEKEIITAEKDTTNNKSQHIARVNYQKLRYDSADAFDRLFTSVANFMVAFYNRSNSGSEKMGSNDTLFVPSVKVESLDNVKFSSIIKRDTLDYLVCVNNFNTIDVKPYYELEFSISISPANKQKKASIESIKIPFINQPRKNDIFFQGSTPFECLATNTIHDFLMVVSKKLREDGYVR